MLPSPGQVWGAFEVQARTSFLLHHAGITAFETVLIGFVFGVLLQELLACHSGLDCFHLPVEPSLLQR